MGVVIVVGGPQYRVGSHRQFVLLARALAAQGVAVLRFDYRGMGDSDGTARTFEDVDTDIRAAIDALLIALPSVGRVYLWGLCDGASAALMYAPSDTRIAGLVLLNPWVRTEAGLARAYVETYYLDRLRDPEFWKKLFTGRLALAQSIREFCANWLRSRQVGKMVSTPVLTFTDRMLLAMSSWKGPALIILSGRDVTAAEFRTWATISDAHRQGFHAGDVEWFEIAAANHTFSSAEWRAMVENETCRWIVQHGAQQ